MGAVRSRRLVGREQEVAALRAALAQALDGRPALAVVEGEAGIGKTRLVRELAEEILSTYPDAVVATGHGVNLAVGTIPYGVASSLVQDLVLEVGEETVARLLGRRAGALDPLLDGLGGDRDGDVLDRLAVFGAAQRLLAVLSRERLVCLFVEDLHWADASSLDLLLFLAATARVGRLLLVATVRPLGGLAPGSAGQVAELARAAAVPVVRLGPLDAVTVRAQVEDALGGAALSEVLLRQVERLSDGVPLYVEELLAAAVGPGGATTLPSTLAVTLTTRVAGLDVEVLRTLQAASVVERPFEAPLLAVVRRRDRDQVLDDLADGVAAGVLDDLVGAYRFHHELLRQAVADSLSPSVRAEWHRAWARALDDVPDRVSDVANHWHLAGDPEMSLRSALAAARAAQRVDAPAEAADHLARAAAVWDQVGDPRAVSGLDRRTLVARLVAAVTDTEDYDRLLAVVVAERGREPHPPAPVRWFFDYYEYLALLLNGRPAEWEAPEVASVVAALSGQPPSELAYRLLEALVGELGFRRVDVRPLVALAEATARAAELPEVELEVLELRCDVAVQAEDWATASAHATELMDRSRGHDPRRYLAGVRSAMVAAWAGGRWKEVVRLGEDTLDRIGAPLADPTAWRLTATVLADSLRLLGRFDRAMEVHASFDELPVALVTGAVDANRAVLAALRGDGDTARELLARSRRAVPALGTEGSDVNWTGMPLWAEATILAEEGQGHAAFAVLRPVLARPDLANVSRFNWVYVLAAAQVLPTSDEEAADLVRRSAALLTPRGAVGEAWQAEVEALLLRAGPHGPDAEAWSRAASRWRDLAAPWHEAGCLLRLGEAWLDDAGNPPQQRQASARDALRRARSLADGIGALPLVARIDALARTARLRLGDAGAPPVADSPLTERETDVLGLLVQGRTNEQIGASLYMSPKTASVHVSRIIAKLGAANRTEVASLAHRRGLV